MSTKIAHPIQTDWWVKSILGAVCSLILAIGLSNVFVVLCKNIFVQDTLVQLAMWGIAIFWLILFFSGFYFRRGWHMVLTMLSLSICVYSMLFWLRG